MTGAPRIRLTIDRLVLEGVAPGDAAAVQRAMAQAIEVRLAQADVAGLGPDRASLNLAVSAGTGPAALGQAAGRALGASIAGERR
jgi:hypothetical protein